MPDIHAIRRRPPPAASPATAAPGDRLPLGCAALDQAIGGGLAFGALHELFAPDRQDAAALAGLATAIAAIAAARLGHGCCWIAPPAPADSLCPRGLVELAGTLPVALLVKAPDEAALLRAAHRAASGKDRPSGPRLLIVEQPGRFARYDLTASRRLHLAAEASGTLLLLLRAGATPVPSAARTRWSVRAAASVALAAHAPGHPAFEIALLRQRGGPAGQAWRLAWNREARAFHDLAALPGAVVSPSAGRAAPAGGVRLAS